MIIEIQNLQTIIPLNLPRLKAQIRKVLLHQRIVDARLSFVFVDDSKIKTLNKKYLRHDYATDVLTFDLRQLGSRYSVDGEIIISSQTAKRHAAAYDVNVKDEILLYMVHGVLHLLGYDDHSPAKIKKMRAQEKKLLAVL
jgi:probable rRNA maturation factor